MRGWKSLYDTREPPLSPPTRMSRIGPPNGGLGTLLGRSPKHDVPRLGQGIDGTLRTGKTYEREHAEINFSDVMIPFV